MKEQLISFETAKLAKEKGFDEICEALYNAKRSKKLEVVTHKNSELNKDRAWYSVPTQSLFQRWLRDKHIIVVNSYANASGFCWESHYTPVRGGTHIADSEFSGPNNSGCWDSYEEALEAGLFEALKLI